MQYASLIGDNFDDDDIKERAVKFRSTALTVLVAVTFLGACRAAPPADPAQVDMAVWGRAQTVMADATLTKVAEATPIMTRSQKSIKLRKSRFSAVKRLVANVVEMGYDLRETVTSDIGEIPNPTVDLGDAAEEQIIDALILKTGAQRGSRPPLGDTSTPKASASEIAALASSGGIEGYLVNARVERHSITSTGASIDESFNYFIAMTSSVIDIAKQEEVGRSQCELVLPLYTYRYMAIEAASLAGRDVTGLKAKSEAYAVAQKAGGDPSTWPEPVDLYTVSTPEEKRTWFNAQAREAAVRCANNMIAKLLN